MRATFIFLFTLAVATDLFAGNVVSCRVPIRDSLVNSQIHRCVLKIPNAKIRDIVKIKNEYGFLVAKGSVIKKTGDYITIEVFDLSEPVDESSIGSVVLQTNN